VSKLFRTKEWLTLAQLTRAWSPELVAGGEDQKECEQSFIHVLMEDIVNGRLDDSGPPRDDGQRLGLRCITSDNKPRFIEGSELLDPIRADQAWVLDNVLIMKETVLDFAQRHQLPSPSWWADSASTSAQVPNDTKVNADKATGAVPSRSVGKQPRIAEYLKEHYPAGVPEPGLCPRHTLKSDIVKWDPGLRPLDEATLKKAVKKHNASLSKRES
jgi:hypothetical protein